MRGPKRALKDDEAVIRELVAKQPDATLEELCEAVAKAANKPRMTTATMCVELQRLQLPLKKSRLTLRKEKLKECGTAESNMSAK